LTTAAADLPDRSARAEGTAITVYLTARKPTDSVTHGIVPAAARLGVPVVVLTDSPADHVAAYAPRPDPPLAVIAAAVFDAGAVVARVDALTRRFGRPTAVFSNSDHLQTPTAMAADLLGLPAKPWPAALRCKNKLLTRRAVAAAGLDVVAAVEVTADDPDDVVEGVAQEVPFPAVVKPREGVASEDVFLVTSPAELRAAVARVRRGRPGGEALVEEYLFGPLHTYDSLGDGARRAHIGSWRTTLGAPPHFVETRMEWDPVLPPAAREHLCAQLDALGVGLGACHTEFVVQGDRARIVEVNYRLVGDTVDLVSAELLGVDLAAALIRVHSGEPLPADLPDPVTAPGHARIDYVLADRPGTLVAAPPDGSRCLADGTRIGHRRLRGLGVHRAVHASNRDYLGAVYGVGRDPAAIDAAVEQFQEDHAWSIEPGPSTPRAVLAS
jgi:biotin carboxylase